MAEVEDGGQTFSGSCLRPPNISVRPRDPLRGFARRPCRSDPHRFRSGSAHGSHDAVMVELSDPLGK